MKSLNIPLPSEKSFITARYRRLNKNFNSLVTYLVLRASASLGSKGRGGGVAKVLIKFERHPQIYI
jgi:hypothetical protein